LTEAAPEPHQDEAIQVEGMRQSIPSVQEALAVIQ